MASASRDRRSEGIEFIHEDDGSITARDIETGLARGGDTRAAALSQLAEVLALAENDDEPIEDPDEFLRTHDIEPTADVETPPWE
ncbi:MAG: hypothetical protein IH933_01230 [Euryarchaeota archaeon]|nr:hypothetical protein [Euryarchaeota archaeon]